MQLNPFRQILAIALCLCTLLTLVPFANAAASIKKKTEQVQTQETVVTAVVTGRVNFRTEPNTSCKSMGFLNKNTQAIVLDNTSTPGWWKVSIDGKEGYVTADYIKLTEGQPAPAPAPETQKPQSSTPSQVKPSGKDPNASKIAAAKKKNSDTIGWIRVPNTNIDDPILYRSNFYYADHDINKKSSLEGVYPYYGVKTKNIALFGHNLRGSGKGFHEMHHMQETALGYSRCQTGSCKKSLGSKHANWVKDNRIWDISIFGMTKWEVWAMYEVKANEPMSTLRNNWSPLKGASNSTVQNWINGQLKRSEVNFGVSVSPKDQFLTIITCGTNYDSANANSRLFIFLKNVG